MVPRMSLSIIQLLRALVLRPYQKACALSSRARCLKEENRQLVAMPMNELFNQGCIMTVFGRASWTMFYQCQHPLWFVVKSGCYDWHNLRLQMEQSYMKNQFSYFQFLLSVGKHCSDQVPKIQYLFTIQCQRCKCSSSFNSMKQHSIGKMGGPGFIMCSVYCQNSNQRMPWNIQQGKKGYSPYLYAFNIWKQKSVHCIFRRRHIPEWT